VEAVHVLPRLLPSGTGSIPPTVRYFDGAAKGKIAFIGALAQRVLSGERYQLIYCAHVNLVPAAISAAALTRAPVVLAIYGIDVWQPLGAVLTALIRRWVSSVVSISAITRDRFLAWCPFPEERIHVVPNAIRLDLYGVAPRSPALVARYNLEGRKVLMTFGRMVGKERAKGFDEIIELLPALRTKMPEVAYLAVGDGPDRPRLEARAVELGVRDSVVFTGRISDEEKADIIRLADLFVMPSRGEGFGFVVLEALACGVPVVASNRDGTREAVLDGEIGVLVDPDNPASVLSGILEGLQRSRQVPSRLEHFSYANFQARLCNALRATKAN
jgi:glycosyltransferase involved in cell wall biosynthesis